ncbi:hypothetical protein MKK70_00230 [Methylobacterium sp. E-041]|uniref:hypothetical protein n=1 Tax=Methylobacterium sp. E-041 TaxID=2836573 RepID=UPI001FBBFEA6|nr:hypothetical protein [Methylobacterium sp. E-041]MCJ2103831.1 hypothetical protein [Methylobacterium sp. E-041]
MTASNENNGRDNRDVLTGADAEKELSPRGREALERIRRDQADDPRKALRENALLQSEIAYREGVSIPQSVRIQLWECGLEDQDIDTWDRLRLIKRGGEPFTPEQEQEYRRICRLVDRCLEGRCDGGGDPPDDDGPDFDRTVGDLIADTRTKKNSEAEPAPVAPQPEPAPVPPDLTPKAKQKPKPRKPVRKDDRGRD